MTKNKVKKLLPALEHFANGGNLWCYNEKEWFKQSELYTRSKEGYIDNIIEDRHFEARKAHALGEEIESCGGMGERWRLETYNLWDDEMEYRPKLKEPIYEWQWYEKISDNYFKLTNDHFTEECAQPDWVKFEPSKRERK